MKNKRTFSGFQRKYLRYTIGLLLLALLLSSAGVWVYMRAMTVDLVTDKYTFLNDKTGVSLDNMYQESEKVTEECIMSDQVQRSLRAKPMAEVDRNSLSKYFAYLDLDHISEYCYVDNKQNLYTRSYSKITYQDFEASGLLEQLGDSYAATVWFVTADTLFCEGERSLFIGRKVHSLDYAHEPGYLFFKMDEEFWEKLHESDTEFMEEAALGVMDPDGRICASWYPENFEMTDVMRELLQEYAMQGEGGAIVRNQEIPGGIVSMYKQKESGFSVFAIVPEQVISDGIWEVMKVLLIIYLLVICFAVICSIYFSDRMTEPVKVLSRAMTEFHGERFDKTVHLHTNTELDQIGEAYNKMLLNMKELLEETKIQQKELRTSELNMLISQINPHFLYNTLDTIYMLARINKEETTMQMIQSLSKYLRLSLSKGSDIVTVEDELENVKSYLQIQQIRNENLFEYSVECLVEPKATHVLKLILQPLVENAIKYGFCDIYEGGMIHIQVANESGKLVFRVFNSGHPMDAAVADKINALNGKPLSEARKTFPKNQKNGYGVMNVLTRLRLKYGEEVQFYYQVQSDGTTCVIEIPEDGGQYEED